MSETRFMAIDFGRKRVGLAMSDPFKIFASPLKTLQNDQFLLSSIIKIIENLNVELIIIGYPIREDGNKGELCDDIDKFKKKLSALTKVQIIYRDEMYTSELAKKKVFESVTKKSKRREKSLIDMNAAAILLQEYLDDGEKLEFLAPQLK
ncbi:MAG: Holliday junction resolvase RuvX [Chlorobiaceae bacterium]|nr:Holliday junction resolvase RuvX [Chlorobiaceae bacterium]MBA4308984.1 Holliday junction resolvase RuvX [Chlorobiaceae bacterium]